MASFSPTMAFSSVDLPTLGRPRMQTEPARAAIWDSGVIAGLLYNLDVMLSGVMRFFAGGEMTRFPVAAGLVLSVLTLATAAGARAAELSSASASDGTLTLQDGGAVIARISLATPPLRRGTPALREVTVEGH